MSDENPTDPTPAGEAEDDRTTELWAYGGVRVLSNGKRTHAWIRDSGRGGLGLYSIAGSYSIGEIYRARVSVSADGSRSLYGQPAYHGDGRVTDERAAEFRAKHHAAQTLLSLAKREREGAARNELDALIAPLTALAGKCRGYHERAAFIAYVLAKL